MRKVLLIGFPAWDTSRDDAPAPARSPLSEAGRALALAQVATAQAKRRSMNDRLRAELAGI